MSSTLGFVPTLPHWGLQDVVLTEGYRLRTFTSGWTEATVLRRPQGKPVRS